MKCSTKSPKGTPAENRLKFEWVLQDWHEVQQALPIDLERTARAAKALQRKREIRSAGDLLRWVFCYALSDWSLRLVAAWALLQGIGNLSDVAVLQRLRNSRVWIGQLIGQLLQPRCQALQPLAGVRLRLMDATVISRPGSQGTDWRVPLGLDLERLGLDGIEVTDAQGGESLARLAPVENEMRVADRGYGYASSLGAMLAAWGGLVVRINWHNLRLETQPGQRFHLIAWLKTVSQPMEPLVWLSTPQGRFELRLLASPLSPEAAVAARRRAQRRNGKKGRTLSAHSLLAAGFLLVVTNLPAQLWPMKRVLWLYRLRWQIELHIKRLKSLLLLDQLRAQDPRLVQTDLLAKLLAALLLEGLTHQVQQQQPDWFGSLERPVSPWRLTAWLWEALRQLIYGRLSLERFFQVLPQLQRYFCDAPRARPQQLAWARAFLEHLNFSYSFFSC